MGLAAVDQFLRQRGFGNISQRGTPLAPFYASLRTAFERTATYVNPRFRFFFIEDGTINGIAYSGLWRSYVGLTFGCVSMLDAVWRLLLRSNHLLRHLQNGEKHEQLRHDIQTTFHLCVVGNDRAEVPDSYFEQLKTSADPVRAELSYRLFKRSLLFLYYHELSHLGRGHPNLCHATGSQPVILEANGGIGDQPIVSNGRPWAEHEADWLATIWLLQNEEWLPDEGQNIEILVEMFIAVGVVFVIFSLAEEKLGRLSVDHPHPSLRLAHLVEESAEFLVAGERYPFQDLGLIQIAAERALEELAIVGVLAGFDWYQSAEKETSRGKEQITSTRLSAGREWVEAANQAMRRTIKRPPPKF